MDVSMIEAYAHPQQIEPVVDLASALAPGALL
jgi:hypothetical protein